MNDSTRRPTLRGHNRLTSAVDLASQEHPGFAAAAESARANASERLEAMLSFDHRMLDPNRAAEDASAGEAGAAGETDADEHNVADGEGVVHGAIAGWTPPEALDALAAALWGPSGRSGFVHVEGVEEQPSREQLIDDDGQARLAGHLFARLDAGWVLTVAEPAGLDPTMASVLGDLETIYGPAALSLHYGIRTGLGPQAPPQKGTQLLVQIAGRRAVSILGGKTGQLKVEAGHLVVVPPGSAHAHLPLDADSLSLTCAFGPSPTAERRAMHRPRATGDLAGVRSLFLADPNAGWPVRFGAPGGLHLPASGDGVIAGGYSLDLDDAGTEIVQLLADGGTHTGASLAAAAGTDVRATVEFLERLTELALCRPLAPPKQLAANPSLSGVARGIALPAEGAVAVAAAASGVDGWRVATEADICGPTDGIEVLDVAALGDDPDVATFVGSAFGAANQLNDTFMHCETLGPLADDPALIVRVRPGGTADLDRAAFSADIVAHSTRKLTFVTPLADTRPDDTADETTAGGWVELTAGSNKTNKGPGEISMWPSFRAWAISPRTEGERLFLIGRLHGPAFS